MIICKFIKEYSISDDSREEVINYLITLATEDRRKTDDIVYKGTDSG